MPLGYLEVLKACGGPDAVLPLFRTHAVPMQAHGNIDARTAGTAPSHSFPEQAGKDTERKCDRSSSLQPEPQCAGGSGAGGFPRVAEEPEH